MSLQIISVSEEILLSVPDLLLAAVALLNQPRLEAG